MGDRSDSATDDLFSSIAMSFETVGAGGGADEFTKTFAEQVVDLATQEQMKFGWVMVHQLDMEGTVYEPDIKLEESPPLVVNPKFIERFETIQEYANAARKYRTIYMTAITLDGEVPQSSGPIHALWFNTATGGKSHDSHRDLVGFPISCSHEIDMCKSGKDLTESVEKGNTYGWYFYSKGFKSYREMKESRDAAGNA